MIKLLIYYNKETIIQANGKLDPVKTYWGNLSRKQPTEANFNKDLQKLKLLAQQRQGKYNAAIIYDMRQGAPGKEIVRF